jgi:glycosyltransferase involved in cell wall biosynthesis
MLKQSSVLYITYDGITDHIGQSQVAPYLIGLAAKGHRITLLSAEKMDRESILIEYQKIFMDANVEWQFVAYHKKPPVLSTVWDVAKMSQLAAKLVTKRQVNIVHCRSYVASLIGLKLKKKYETRFIFDMRDFWPDSAKEIKRFDIEKNPVHRIVYKYFKRKETEFLKNADYIVSLTRAGKEIIEDWSSSGMNVGAPIKVIPCCADFGFYDRERLDVKKVNDLRSRFKISKDEFVLGYVGSLGPSYLIKEMMDLFKRLLERRPNAKFLMVANNDHHLALDAARNAGLSDERVIVLKAAKEQVPYFISLFNLSVFFYYTHFARKACSPTRLAELFAMNVPVIANSGVGDLDTLLDPSINHSTVVKDFSQEALDCALAKVLPLVDDPTAFIRRSANYFSLSRGIELYNQIYDSLSAPAIEDSRSNSFKLA